MSVLDKIERRVLGAFRCVDSYSGQQVRDALLAGSTQLDIRRNASAFYVVFNGPGMSNLTTQFDVAAAWPNSSDYDVTLRPGTRRYLPRLAKISMPRQPVKMDQDNSSMVPQDVILYPGPVMAFPPTWAVVRLSIKKGNTDVGLPYVVAQMTRDSDKSVIATGMSDEHGEAVLAVGGVGQAANENGGGAVVAVQIDAHLNFYGDANTLKRVDGKQGKAPALVNPETFLHDPGTYDLKQPQAVHIGRGTSSHFTIAIGL